MVFLDDFEHAIEVMVSHPEIAPILQGRVRRKVLRKFPYCIIYSIVGDEIRYLISLPSTSPTVLLAAPPLRAPPYQALPSPLFAFPPGYPII